MIIGTPWAKYYDDELEEFRFPVYLSYFETKFLCLSKLQAGKCSKRDGVAWKKVRPQEWVLKKDLFWWLERKIGSQEIVWPIDRIYYPDEQLPLIPKGSGYQWQQKHDLHPIDREDHRWIFQRLMAGQREEKIQNQFSNIIFKSAEDAQKFFDVWQLNGAEWGAEYRFNHPMFRDGTECSDELIDWMSECVGERANDAVDFLQGQGDWCSIFDERAFLEPGTGRNNLRTYMILWFRDPKSLTLTKLTWA